MIEHLGFFWEEGRDLRSQPSPQPPPPNLQKAAEGAGKAGQRPDSSAKKR